VIVRPTLESRPSPDAARRFYTASARSCHCRHCMTALPSGRFRLHSSHRPRCGTHMRIIVPHPRASQRSVAHLGGRCRMPGRTDSTPRPRQHRITNSISASPGRCQRDELPRPSWGDSCLWAQDRPTASDLLPTGSDCGLVQAVSQELSARNPRLTSAATPGDTPQGAIEFLSSAREAHHARNHLIRYPYVSWQADRNPVAPSTGAPGEIQY